MKKIALATAALLVAAGSAFAENPNVGASAVPNAPQANVDRTYTASVRETGSPVYKLLNTQQQAQWKPVFGADHNLFGNR